MSGAYVFHTPISLWKYFVTLFRNLDRISPQLIFLLIRQVYLSVDLSSFGLKVQDVCWAGDLIRNVLQELCRVINNYNYDRVKVLSVTELLIFTICTHHLPTSRSFHPISAQSPPQLSIYSDQETVPFFNQDYDRSPLMI